MHKCKILVVKIVPNPPIRGIGHDMWVGCVGSKNTQDPYQRTIIRGFRVRALTQYYYESKYIFMSFILNI